MLELTIKGKDAHELFANAAQIFGLMAMGAKNVSAGAQGSASAPAEAPKPDGWQDFPPSDDVAVPEENPKVTAEPKTRKARTPKAPVVIDNEPPAETPKDEDPLGLNDVKSDAPTDAPQYTVDDMRQRVKDIIANGTARGQDMPTNVAYVRKLFAPFGVKLAAEVPPGKFAEFIEKSAPYLDGTAK